MSIIIFIPVIVPTSHVARLGRLSGRTAKTALHLTARLKQMMLNNGMYNLHGRLLIYLFHVLLLFNDYFFTISYIDSAGSGAADATAIEVEVVLGAITIGQLKALNARGIGKATGEHGA